MDFWIPVAESAHSIAAVSNHQRSLGSLTLISKRHCGTIAELPPVEAVDLHRMMRLLNAAIDRAYDPDGINVWQGGRLPAGGRLPHIHVHLCPRYAGKEYSYVVNEDLRLPPVEEREEIARRIRAEVEQLQSQFIEPLAGSRPGGR
ncbi:HIT family protein [Streptomyces sp. NPDC059629]|uniref:HIT family protein n=1 Tax=Streptomyces sp. NPDC059629 TaxID=3346889 RepID=UPI0036778465